MKQILQTLEVDERRILQELKSIAFARVTDVMEGDAYNLKDLNTLSEETKAAIKKIKRQEGKTFRVEVEMHDKIKALGKLAEYIGMESGEGGGSLSIVVNTGIDRAPDEAMIAHENEKIALDNTEGYAETAEKVANGNDHDFEELMS